MKKIARIEKFLVNEFDPFNTDKIEQSIIGSYQLSIEFELPCLCMYYKTSNYDQVIEILDEAAKSDPDPHLLVTYDYYLDESQLELIDELTKRGFSIQGLVHVPHYLSSIHYVTELHKLMMISHDIGTSYMSLEQQKRYDMLWKLVKFVPAILLTSMPSSSLKTVADETHYYCVSNSRFIW